MIFLFRERNGSGFLSGNIIKQVSLFWKCRISQLTVNRQKMVWHNGTTAKFLKRIKRLPCSENTMEVVVFQVMSSNKCRCFGNGASVN
jgi:hypothetical protein